VAQSAAIALAELRAEWNIRWLQRSPAALGRRAVWEETPNAGSGQRRGLPSTGTAEGRSCQVAEFQCDRIKPSKRRSTRVWPHNANGKHHRAKVSAAFVIEAAALSFAGAGNLPGLLRALRISDTAWL
jgi:hypothetical protein